MAEVRIRVKLDQGFRGVRLNSLVALAAETQKLLRMLGEDVGIEPLQTNWVATDFENASLSFAVASTGEADDEQATVYRRAFSRICTYDPRSRRSIAGIRDETLVQFARVATAVEVGESLRLGVVENGRDVADWCDVSQQRASGILEYFEDRIEYAGMIHGIIHSLYKEAQPAYFDVRDITSSQLVKCLFSAELYATVWKLLQRKDSIVLIAGDIRARRTDKKIDSITVSRMEAAPTLSDEEFERFFGCAPGFTGKLTTSRYIDRIRRHGR